MKYSCAPRLGGEAKVAKDLLVFSFVDVDVYVLNGTELTRHGRSILVNQPLDNYGSSSCRTGNEKNVKSNHWGDVPLTVVREKKLCSAIVPLLINRGRCWAPAPLQSLSSPPSPLVC